MRQAAFDDWHALKLVHGHVQSLHGAAGKVATDVLLLFGEEIHAVTVALLDVFAEA
ncbi:hypothetical protein D3C86_1937060 [compost metagenome]